MEGLDFLKKEGHILLDEYVELDDKRTGNDRYNHAYKKLSNKLRVEPSMAHFKNMTTGEEVLAAMFKIRKMIEKRKNRIYFTPNSKTKFAPNLREIQRNISLENSI